MRAWSYAMCCMAWNLGVIGQSRIPAARDAEDSCPYTAKAVSTRLPYASAKAGVKKFEILS